MEEFENEKVNLQNNSKPLWFGTDDIGIARPRKYLTQAVPNSMLLPE